MVARYGALGGAGGRCSGGVSAVKVRSVAVDRIECDDRAVGAVAVCR